MAWSAIAGVIWVAGAFVTGDARMLVWIGALVLDLSGASDPYAGLSDVFVRASVGLRSFAPGTNPRKECTMTFLTSILGAISIGALAVAAAGAYAEATRVPGQP